MARIGIKLADGSFFPVIENDSPQRKRMVLTVARDGQTSAQIDLLRRDGEAEQYVGCLVLEDLPEDKPSELELVVGVDDEGNVDARVGDTAGRQYQSFSVNLAMLEASESFSLPEDDADLSLTGDIGGVDSLEEIDLPDLEDTEEHDLSEIDLDAVFDEPETSETDETVPIDASVASPTAADSAEQPVDDEFAMPDVSLRDDDDDAIGSSSVVFEDDDEEMEETIPPRPFSALSLAAVLLIGLSLVALGAFMVFRWLQTDALPELRAAAVVVLTPSLRRMRNLATRGVRCGGGARSTATPADRR